MRWRNMSDVCAAAASHRVCDICAASHHMYDAARAASHLVCDICGIACAACAASHRMHVWHRMSKIYLVRLFHL